MKRFFAFLAVAFVLLPATAGTAGDYNEIFYERAHALMLRNNTDLVKMEYSLKKAEKEYSQYLRRIEDNEDKMPINPMMRYSFMYNRELTPVRMEDTIITLNHNLEIYKNSLKANYKGSGSRWDTRTLYASMYGSFCEYGTQRELLELAETAFLGSEKAYCSGMLGDLDYEREKRALLEQRVITWKAKRELENTTRELNRFIGVDLNNMYDAVRLSSETERAVSGFDEYLSGALQNRAEITGMKRRISIKNMERDIMDKNPNIMIYKEIARQYGDLVGEIERLELELDQTLHMVEQEIRNAYEEVISASKGLELTKKQVAIEEKRLSDSYVMLEKGFVSDTEMRKMEIMVREMQDSLRVEIFNFNTLVMRLEYASGTGPGF